MSESREFRWKNKAYMSQGSHFATIFSKNRCFYWKTINATRFFIVKISVPTNFTYLRLKVPMEIYQIVVSLDSRIARILKNKQIFIITNKIWLKSMKFKAYGENLNSFLITCIYFLFTLIEFECGISWVDYLMKRM